MKKIGRPLKDIAGQRFGELVVLARDASSTAKGSRWLCKCDCGNEAVVWGASLKDGQTKTCGCSARRKSQAALETGRKACSQCGEVKPLEAFSVQRAKLDGRNAECRDCNRWRFRELRFGISREAFTAMAEAQGWTCGNCRCHTRVDEASPVDHDHMTGAVRAILCRGCNTALGQLMERRERVLGLAEYLDAHKRS